MVIALITLLWVLFAACVVGVIAALVIAADRNFDSTAKAEKAAMGFGGTAFVLLILVLVITLGVKQVNAGYRGVVLRFGATTERTLGPGLHFITPFVNSVQMMDVQIHAEVKEAAAASKDLQDVKTQVTLNYYIDPTQVAYVWANLRRDYITRVIDPSIQESVKATTALFNAEELITRRPDVKAAIAAALQGRLAEHGIQQDTISITDFQFSATFTTAIEAKVTAVQRALEAENKLKQVQWEAAQAKAAAEGKANAAIAEAEGAKQAAILRAEGEAQAIRTVADAQAEANRVVNLTLTDAIIRYALVQKLASGIKVILLPTGQSFILGADILSEDK